MKGGIEINYRVTADNAFEWGIEETLDPADDLDRVFSTYSEAKSMLIKCLVADRDQYAISVRLARRFKKDAVIPLMEEDNI